MRGPWSICTLIAAAAAAAAFLSTTCQAHMEMKSPPPRRSKYNPSTPQGDIDYSMTSPLLDNGSNFPCKRYPAGRNVAVVKAGSVLNVQMAGTVFHLGGHCQWSISYDGGKTFLALKTVLNNCFTGTGLSIPVPFPRGLPRCEHCVFAWTWVNAVGNRELYMNCADIGVSSTSSGPFTGPSMVVANLPGFPRIPEFRPGSGQDAGTALYRNAKKVTVRASGANNPQPTSAQSRDEPAQIPPPPHPQAPPPPPPTNGGGGACALGSMRCSGATAYSQCQPAAGGGGSQWSVAMPCAPGTRCSPNGAYISCS